MFWGLIMEPNKRYTQIVDKSFHVSMASLDVTTADDTSVQVMLCYDDKTYLLCTLKKNSTWQVPLDLNFEQGTKIAFTCNGHGHVHLTGYLVPEEDSMFDDLEDEDDEEEEEIQTIDKQSKRKATNTVKGEQKAKRIKQESSNNKGWELDGINEDDQSDSSDEDVSISSENEVDSEENDDEEDEEVDEEEEDIEEEEEEEDEEVQQEQKQKKQEQDKKNKKVQQQPQQQKKKEDKKKLVNGKEMKQEPQTQNKEQKKKKGEQQQQQEQQKNSQQDQNEQKKRVLERGVVVEDLKVGNGTAAKAGKFVSVYYVGRLKNGKKFDAMTQGDGFKFRLGKGEVIKGWDIGVVGMKVGGKRRLTIPPPMAYGAKGSPPAIPGNSTLVFEVELRNVY